MSQCREYKNILRLIVSVILGLSTFFIESHGIDSEAGTSNDFNHGITLGAGIKVSVPYGKLDSTYIYQKQKKSSDEMKESLKKKAIKILKKAKKKIEDEKRSLEELRKIVQQEKLAKEKQMQALSKLKQEKGITVKEDKETVITLTEEGIYFPFNSIEIQKEAYPVLDKITEYLQQNEDAKVEIAGHTDNVGNSGYNKKLSLQRAENVKEYFVKTGNLPETNLSCIGYGDTKPIAPNDNPEERKKNRRVEIVISHIVVLKMKGNPELGQIIKYYTSRRFFSLGIMGSMVTGKENEGEVWSVSGYYDVVPGSNWGFQFLWGNIGAREQHGYKFENNFLYTNDDGYNVYESINHYEKNKSLNYPISGIFKYHHNYNSSISPYFGVGMSLAIYKYYHEYHYQKLKGNEVILSNHNLIDEKKQTAIPMVNIGVDFFANKKIRLTFDFKEYIAPEKFCNFDPGLSVVSIGLGINW